MRIFDKIKSFCQEEYEKIIQSKKSWSRKYDFFMIFGQKEDNNYPWIKSNWERDFEPYIDLLLKQSENYKQTSIRATIYKPETKIAKNDNKEFIYHSEVKLGRLTWNTKSHEKWTLAINDDKLFVGSEIWTPIWTVCDKNETSPDIFISISNENDFENKRRIEFGYFMIIAVAKKINVNTKSIIEDFSQKITPKITVMQTRTWDKTETIGNWTFNNWIQDTYANGIYKGKNIHSFDFDELEFEPFWEIIYKQNKDF